MHLWWMGLISRLFLIRGKPKVINHVFDRIEMTETIHIQRSNPSLVLSNLGWVESIRSTVEGGQIPRLNPIEKFGK